MKLTTSALDQAAFYSLLGAKLLSINGKYPDNSFSFEVPRFIHWYESIGGWIPYNQFCNERKRLKKRCRKIAGLPEYFTGHVETGFKLMDMAIIKPWRKSE